MTLWSLNIYNIISGKLKLLNFFLQFITCFKIFLFFFFFAVKCSMPCVPAMFSAHIYNKTDLLITSPDSKQFLTFFFQKNLKKKIEVTINHYNGK